MECGVNLDGAVEEAVGVVGVGVAEDDGGGGEGGGGLGGDVGAGVGGVDLVDGARGVHVLGALPAGVVAEGVADLDVHRVGRRRRLHQVVRRPPHRLPRLRRVRPEAPPEVDQPPRHERRRERHREPELHVVAGVVVPSQRWWSVRRRWRRR
ncbi:Os06g0257050 [Oryza sativa Japonica Group]|uniref:Os06g0257050 protein n=1 Tax=Oryza sativa subsp. japonica TaxID=39947 RepID=A0A0P0WVF1_ORYSJ|nr:hypothetical protein EE612_033171 [Oryza sativa]BAS97103.1 Os06g0257050 [Oryza sativa Japonica Group]